MPLFISSHAAVAPPVGGYFAFVLTQPATDTSDRRRWKSSKAESLATSGVNFSKLRQRFVVRLANTFGAKRQDFCCFRGTLSALFALGHNKLASLSKNFEPNWKSLPF
jgi:hypothetical protein